MINSIHGYDTEQLKIARYNIEKSLSNLPKAGTRSMDLLQQWSIQRYL